MDKLIVALKQFNENKPSLGRASDISAAVWRLSEITPLSMALRRLATEISPLANDLREAGQTEPMWFKSMVEEFSAKAQLATTEWKTLKVRVLATPQKDRHFLQSEVWSMCDNYIVVKGDEVYLGQEGGDFGYDKDLLNVEAVIESDIKKWIEAIISATS